MTRQFLKHLSARMPLLAGVCIGAIAAAGTPADAAVIVSSDLTYITSSRAQMTAAVEQVTVSEYTASGGTEISTGNNHFLGRLDGSSEGRIANRAKVATIEAAVEKDVYGAFTIEVEDGQQLDLSSLKIGLQITNATSSETFVVHLRSSLDNYAQDIGTVSVTGNDTALAEATGSFNLAGLPNLTGETTFRLYMVSNLEANTSVRYIRIMPDIVLEGTVAPIPEPAAMGLAGIGGVLMLGRRRRVHDA